MSRAIRVFNTAIQTFQKSQKDLAATKTAREKNKRDQETFDSKQKIRKEQLKEAVNSGRMTKLNADFQEAQFNASIKQQKSIFKGKEAQIDLAEQDADKSSKQSLSIARKAYGADPYGVEQSQSGLFDPVGIGGNVFMKRRKIGKNEPLTLPPEVKSQRQAVDYIMQTRKLGREEAVELLKSN